MAVLRTLISLAATAMLIQLSMAANYTVGGPNGGWDTSSNVQSWASSQSFSVGDNLVFQYPPNHNVVEVPKSDFDSCQTSNAIKTYSDGNTVISLSSSGKRYFICGTPGHCAQGMKVEIDTLATSSPPTAAPSTAPTSPVTPDAVSPSPAKSPSSAPTLSSTSPSSSPASPSNSPVSSPPPLPDVPTTTISPSGSSPRSSPSSATRSGLTTLTMGFSLGVVMLLAL